MNQDKVKLVFKKLNGVVTCAGCVFFAPSACHAPDELFPCAPQVRDDCCHGIWVVKEKK